VPRAVRQPEIEAPALRQLNRRIDGPNAVPPASTPGQGGRLSFSSPATPSVAEATRWTLSEALALRPRAGQGSVPWAVARFVAEGNPAGLAPTDTCG
jgi:hypothetical protein